MGINDESVFSEYKREEFKRPVSQKVVGDCTIYLLRLLPLTFGPPVLCDFSKARLGDEEHQDDIMPDVYRAPKVILGMRWSYKVDIWNVAMVVRKLIPNIFFPTLNADSATYVRSLCVTAS